MSTIKIALSTQVLDFFPQTMGQIDIVFNDGSNNHNLSERLREGVSIFGYFTEVDFVSGQSIETSEQQASNFARRFAVDYKNVGGVKNISVTRNGNEVTISAKSGTFVSSAYTGNVLVVGSGVIDNSVQEQNLELISSIQPTGDCNSIDYNISLTGGAPNYIVKNGTTDILTDWDGGVATISLARGVYHNLHCYDSNNKEVARTISVPRKLKIGEFKLRTTNYETYSDLLIENVNPVTGTTPIEYSLDGTNYQTSNVYPSVLPGLYALYVKDVFGCVITKSISVTDFQDVTETENPNYFLIPEANCLTFYKKEKYTSDIRKNYFNTKSKHENVIGKSFQIEQCYLEDDVPPTMFKSSFDYHVITLIKCDGTKQDVPSVMIQENLGSKEKLDCKTFPVGTQTGVYFDGGNQYTPDTNTIIDSSDYNQFTPDWSKDGQLVFLDGLGGFYISGTGFDEDRGHYFLIDAETTSVDVEEKVQVTYNKHDYNLFLFNTHISSISSSAMLRIEYGYDFNNIVGTYESEVIKKIEDSEKYHLVKWGDIKNRGNMVYSNNVISPFVRIKGDFVTTHSTVAESERGDSSSASLLQSAYLGFSFKIGGISSRLVHKLDIASGTLYFEVDNIQLTRSKETSNERYGKSNLRNWLGEFEYGGNELGVMPDEIVLNPSTGVIGGGSSAKIPIINIPVYDNKTRYVDSLGNFIVSEGGFVSQA